MTYDPIDTGPDDNEADKEIGVESATIDGDPAGGFPSTTTSDNPGFDSWTQVDASRPAFVIVQATAETDGTSGGQISIDVDESGGTSADYSLNITAPAAAADGFRNAESVLLYLPAGAQFQIRNASDPNMDNSIDNVREAVL